MDEARLCRPSLPFGPTQVPSLGSRSGLKNPRLSDSNPRTLTTKPMEPIVDYAEAQAFLYTILRAEGGGEGRDALGLLAHAASYARSILQLSCALTYDLCDLIARLGRMSYSIHSFIGQLPKQLIQSYA